MDNKLNIKIGSKDCAVFLQDGFYSYAIQKTPLHKHSYAEIHIVTNGTIDFKIGDVTHSSAKGNLIFIPDNTFHCVIRGDQDACHVAFQIDCDAQGFLTKQISPQTVQDFLNEIEKCRATNDYTMVSTYISLFYSHLYSEGLQARPIADYRFLIYEFLSRHYNEELQLSDLAKALHLSERQAERLVVKYTQNTFREELAAIRINVANHLLNTTSMTLTEVARYVGYRSYSGFWKAMKKHGCR